MICFHEISVKETTMLTWICCEGEEIGERGNLLWEEHGYFQGGCGCRACSDGVLHYFWSGFVIIFILTRGIVVSRHQMVCGYYNL